MELQARFSLGCISLYWTLCGVGIVTGSVYKWNYEPPSYSYHNRFLSSQAITLTRNRHVVTQCAMDCLKTAECRSFNFLPESSMCLLNDRTHNDLDLQINMTSEYYTRETFSIHPLALGMCTGVTCQNGGKCIETKDPGGQDVFVCVCTPGWTGEYCQTELSLPSWGDWKSWGPCSVTCGTGWRMRQRDCIDGQTHAVIDSFRCPSKDTDIEACDLEDCPRWDHWGEWSSCSTETTCGKGQRTRTRTCAYNGTPGVDRYCMGPVSQTGFCHSIDCRAPVRLKDGLTFGEGRLELLNDQTGNWGLVCADQWDMNAANTACRQMGFSGASEVITDGRYGTGETTITLSDVSCQGGGRTLQRCQHSVWNVNTSCPSSNAAGVKCKVDGDWNMWTEWGECSVTCGDGIQSRARECNLPPALHGGEPCSGPNIDQRSCSQPACPGSGQWANWGPWEACDVTCGDGSQRRYRSCADTEVSCRGDSEETQSCSSNVPCPVNGLWQQWSAWSQCDVTCGGGRRTRERNCTLPLHGGEDCTGDSKSISNCNTHPCPVDGFWLEWSAWSDCTVTCGTGTQTRHRACQYGKHGGANCTGTSFEARDCNTHHCPVDGFWLGWSDWSVCTVACGTGSQGRMRDCIPSKYGGVNCTGVSIDKQNCNTHPCPVDGYWDIWSGWSVCTLSCGNGTQERIRDCVTGKHGGANCTGSSSEVRECNAHPCPVDGFWLAWSDWSNCSLSCGNGTHQRMRECYPGKYGGANCTGDKIEAEECNTHHCPVNGFWLAWSDWSDCTLSCGIGTRQRMRECKPGKYGGTNCTGLRIETQKCNTHHCPVDGYWLEWSDWSVCTLPCGKGSQIRRRDCNPGQYGGRHCSGSSDQTQTCNTHHCPVDGFWLEWSDWSECTLSCNNGTQSRIRECNPGKYGGANCSGSSIEIQECNTHHCPVDGFWTEWSIWSSCTASCGNGSQERMRECFPAQHGGANCSGKYRETQECNTHHCPVDGFWLEWSPWSLCSQSCGSGSRGRMRVCVPSQYGGINCSGNTTETQQCNIHPCPVDGYWLEWSDWTECTLSCGNGSQVRMRDCVSGKHGGANCSGLSSETQECNTHHCPEDGSWSSWAPWSECTVSCGGGDQQRQRICQGQRYGGKPCEGPDTGGQDCNTHSCPVDGVFEEWTPWGECSLSCAGGIKTRTRVCTEPKYGGKDCVGERDEKEACNIQPCPVDGEWQPWSDWDACTVTCGGGTRQRERACTGTAHGGKECEGTNWEVEDCSTNPCPVDGVYQEWSPWENCTVSCGGGTKKRTRVCAEPRYGGKDCVGQSEEQNDCNTHPCPVDGEWQPWSDWDTCTVTCGGGTRQRERACTGTAHGGKECEGTNWEVEDCSTKPCPVDGEFTEWSVWGDCSATCGGGTQTRKRDCILPQYGGKPCDGDRYEIQDCGMDACPVDGRWNMWGEWDRCSVTCGFGLQLRTRTCDGPYHGGDPCDGLAEEHRDCEQPPCLIPGDWHAWSKWTSCSATCGGGSRRRSRQCDMTSHGNLTAPCPGDQDEVGECHTFPCQPYARSCSALRELGLTESVEADIDPDGPGGDAPIQVLCDMEAEGGLGVTVISHDQETEMKVNGFEGPGEFDTGTLIYNATWEQILTLVDNSDSCKQFIRWKCYGALIHSQRLGLDDYILTTFWRNRTGGVADYWGGASPGSDSCDCGMTNTCDESKYKCNCDANDAVWREDAGFITVKDDLPVTSFAAGDTGTSDEAGAVIIGPLKCFEDLT